MTREHSPFTSDDIDEQIDRFAQRQEVAPTAGQQPPDARLIHDLQALHQVDPAIARALERVRQRLDQASLSSAAGASPVATPGRRLSALPARASRPQKPPRFLQSRARLATLVAVMALVTLVGGLSLGLALVHHPGQRSGLGGSTTPSPSSTAPAAPPASVYVDSNVGVSKIDAKTGKVLWSTPFESTSVTRVVVADGVVYVSNSLNAPGSTDSTLYALSASTGQVLWKKTIDLSGRVSSQITMVDGVVYIGAGSEGTLYALDARDGTVRWHTQVVQDFSSEYPATFYAVAVVQGVVYGSVVSGLTAAGPSVPVAYTSALYALRAQDGRRLWETPAPPSQAFNGIVFTDNTIYVTAYTSAVLTQQANHVNGSRPGTAYYGYAEAYRPADGTLIWQSQDANGLALALPTIANGVVYFCAQEDGVYAVKANDGTPLWHTMADGESYNVPYAVNGVVYVGEGSLLGSSGPASVNGMVALDASTGATLWRHELATYVGHNDFAVGGGVMYVATSDGSLSALNASDGSLLWNTMYVPHRQFSSTAVTLAP